MPLLLEYLNGTEEHVQNTAAAPRPFNRHHLSCADCQVEKMEDYQNCSLLYCVPVYRDIRVVLT